jgi:hypothetical protein
LRLVAQPPREGLARHAAAVALAFSVAACTKVEHQGISEFAAPPLQEAGLTVPSASVPVSIDASVPETSVRDAGKPKPTPTKDAGKPPIIEHHGISEFAAPPLRVDDMEGT